MIYRQQHRVVLDVELMLNSVFYAVSTCSYLFMQSIEAELLFMHNI